MATDPYAGYPVWIFPSTGAQARATATVGIPFSYQLSASGVTPTPATGPTGNTGYTASVASRPAGFDFIPGLNWTPQGSISGTPTLPIWGFDEPGYGGAYTYQIVVSARNAVGNRFTTVWLTVRDPNFVAPDPQPPSAALVITGPPIINAVKGSFITPVTITTTGDRAGYAFTINPQILVCDATTGVLSGRPTVDPGRYPVRYTATNASWNLTATFDATVIVADEACRIVTERLIDVQWPLP